jgi:hypothetical protein
MLAANHTWQFYLLAAIFRETRASTLALPDPALTKQGITCVLYMLAALAIRKQNARSLSGALAKKSRNTPPSLSKPFALCVRGSFSARMLGAILLPRPAYHLMRCSNTLVYL